MTIPEINREIKAWGWREERHNRFVASALYRVPQLIGVAVLDGKQYPEINIVFPELFSEEEIQKSKEIQQTKKDIATFQAWAESFNRNFERNE